MELVSSLPSGELTVAAPEPPTRHAIPVYLNAQTQFPQDPSKKLPPHLAPSITSLAELPRSRKEKEFLDALSSLPSKELDVLLEYSPLLKQLVDGTDRGRAMRLAQHADNQQRRWLDEHLATENFAVKTSDTVDSALVEIYGARFAGAILPRPRDGWAFYASIPVKTGENSETIYNVNFRCIAGATRIAQEIEKRIKKYVDWQQMIGTRVPIEPYAFVNQETYPPTLTHQSIQLPNTSDATKYYLILSKGTASDHKTNYPLEWRLVIDVVANQASIALDTSVSSSSSESIPKKSFAIFYKTTSAAMRTSGVVNTSFVPYFDIIDPRMLYDLSEEQLRAKNVVTLVYQNDDESEFTLNGHAYIPYVITMVTRVSDTLSIVSLAYCGERRKFLQRRRGVSDDTEYSTKTAPLSALRGDKSAQQSRIIPDFFFQHQRSFQILWPTNTIDSSGQAVPLSPLSNAQLVKTDTAYTVLTDQERAAVDNAFLNNCRTWYLSYYLEAFDCETQGRYRC